MTGLDQTEQEMFAFWRARLDEDDQLTRAACAERGGVWRYVQTPGGDHRVLDSLGYSVAEYCPVESEPWFTLPHVARHDPARVLRYVTSGRARLELLAEAIGAGNDSYDLAAALLPMELAAYDQHPDYKESWRP